MKKRFIVCLIFCLGVAMNGLAQTTSQDSVTIKQLEADKAKLNQRVGELTKRNAAIENAFIVEYLNQQGKQAGKAFIDQYLYIKQLEGMVQYYKEVTNDFARIENMKEWEGVMEKHNIPKVKKE